MMPHLWTVFTPSLLVYVVWVLTISLMMLALGYLRARRWDAEWKHKWERRHRRPLVTLYQRQQQGMVALVVFEIVLGVMALLGLCLVFWVLGRSSASDRSPIMVLVAVLLPAAPLVALVYFDLMRRLTIYRINRLKQLLSHETIR